jgi:hypothetical protein
MGRGDKPGQDEWSQGRRAAKETPGYAPAPKTGAAPRPLSNRLPPGSPGLKPKWTPNAGWKPTAFQNPGSRASIYGAKIWESLNGQLGRVGSNFGGGGGDPKSQKKR